jgi:hypothetical protein
MKFTPLSIPYVILEEVKYHWSLFSVFKILQEKLHRVDVSNIDAKVKVGWLEVWNDNRFDKNALYFPKSSLFDFVFDNWLSKSIYWVQLKLSKNFRVFFHIIFSSLQMCILSPSISKSRSLRLSMQYSIVNSKAEK